jgi:leucyl aminopeptidase
VLFCSPRYDPGLPKRGQGSTVVELPDFSPLQIVQKAQRAQRSDLEKHDHVLIVVSEDAKLPRSAVSTLIAPLRKRAAARDSRSISMRLANTKATGITVNVPRAPSSPFVRLTWARKTVQSCIEADTTRLAVLVMGFDDDPYREIIEALVLAAEAAAFALPTFKSETSKFRLRRLTILDAHRMDLGRVRAEALGNNIARWFTQMPPNMLTARDYRRMLEQLAKTHELKSKFFDERALARNRAGAFLAVAQGNADREAGILRLSFVPRNPKPYSLALVGKGILFDTGGNNLKSFRSMLDMHTDMQGSAVAAGALVSLAALGVPYRVDAWLAITENRVSATAYKSQDVVTASNGTTIQVIHTDAEGRMVLADTLALASKDAPSLIIDYATLTGACVTALTTSYSGVFSNREHMREHATAAGRRSGERVWPFPMDEDFDEALKSEVADIKQCAEDGAGDHILAARFLSRFVPESVPWLHVDLSAAQHKGGLGHVATEYTGFGVRWTLDLLERQLRLAGGTERLSDA